MMRISAFGDEAATDFEEQLQVLSGLDIPLVDVRAAWGVNCADFTSDHIKRINALCAQYNVLIACMGSPIGKSLITDPIQGEIERLKRIGGAARQLNTRNIRLFSFYPAAGESADDALPQSIDRLTALTATAAEHDLQLLLENEKGVVGDLPGRCLQILAAVDSPHLRFIWDPANFVQCGVADQVDRWWARLSPYIGYIHIKDALLPDAAAADAGRSTVTVAGAGDGQVAELLAHLHAADYAGVLSLEPHLLEARHSSGFSGAEGMAQAVGALRQLLTTAGIEEGR